MIKNFKFLFLTILLSLVITGCNPFASKPVIPPSPTPIPPTPTPMETQLPESERPIVTLTPDSKLQKVNIKITNLPDDVKEIDMELIYLTGDTERGQISTYYVNKAKNEVLLGTCSSGTCVYDKDISNGTLTLTYVTDGNRVLLRYPFDPKLD